MKADHKKIEQDGLVYCNWLVFGLVGAAFLFEGGARDDLIVGIIGILLIITGFVGHIILNYLFERAFSKAEAALGMGLFALVSVIFIAAWLIGTLSVEDIILGLGLLSALVVGFFAYATTRYGVAGAFRRFDTVAAGQRHTNDD